jgi:hypothetical protein
VLAVAIPAKKKKERRKKERKKMLVFLVRNISASSS